MLAAMLRLASSRDARLDKPDSRIDAERKRALLALPPVGQAPVLGSVRTDQQVQAAAIGELARLDLPLRIPTLCIRERHVGISIMALMTYQQIYQQNPGMSASGGRTSANATAAIYLYKIRSLVAFGERRRMSTNAGGSSMWWAFLDTYRTLCLAPTPEVREIFEKLRTEHLVDLRL
jgi:hypothetical protein